MKSKFNVYDPMVQQALIAQGSQFMVPPAPQYGVPPALDPGGGPSMQQQIGALNGGALEMPQPQPQSFQALSPQTLEELYAQMQAPEPAPPPVSSLPMAQQIGMMNSRGPVIPTAFAGSPSQFAAPRFEQPVEPLARVQQPQGPAAEQTTQRPARTGGARPSQSMQERDAAFEGILEGYDNRARIAADAEAARADTADQRARLMERSTVDDMMAQQELADAADAHQGATAKVKQEQRDDAEFIRSYVPSDRRTTSQRVMGAIAVALSGIADGMTAGAGGQGHAMERTLGVINMSIDRDIDLQQRMLDNKKTALAAKNTELGQMRERYGDSVESIKLARAMKIDQYQKELDSVVAGGASQEAAAAAKDTQAQLEMQKQQLMFDVYGSRFQQELKARQGMGAAQRLTLEGKALDNEKKRQDLAAGPEGEKLSGDERKVQRSLGAVKPAADRLDKMLRSDKTPYVGVRSGTQGIPDLFVPNENIQYRNDVTAVAGQALRDDSGAVLGPEELADKLERMGVFSGSAAMRRQGLKDLKYEYDSRLNRGQAPKETPESAARSRLRPGAAR